MNLRKLANHVNLCKKNLKSKRVKCCGNCPFEHEIVMIYPDLKKEFVTKRKWIIENKNLS